MIKIETQGSVALRIFWTIRILQADVVIISADIEISGRNALKEKNSGYAMKMVMKAPKNY
ncbi:MAG: hypothetical protein ACLTJG_15325 [[Clostridium] innocuum]